MIQLEFKNYNEFVFYKNHKSKGNGFAYLEEYESLIINYIGIILLDNGKTNTITKRSKVIGIIESYIRKNKWNKIC